MISMTLALNPRINRCFQVLLTPFVSDILSRYLGINSILSINQLGFKHQDKTPEQKEDDLNKYLSLVKSIGIRTQNILTDTSTEYLFFVQECVKKMLESGILNIRNGDILRCDCGGLEGAEDILNKLSNRSSKVISNRDEKLVCNLCKTRAKFKKSRGIYFSRNSKNFHQILIFYQDWVKNEFLSLGENLDGDLYISRERNTNPQVEINGEIFYLDIDFFCSFIALYISKTHNEKEIIIIATPQTIVNAFSIAYITKIISSDINMHIVIPPMIKWSDKTEPNCPNADLFVDKYSTLQYRLALALGLSWRRKEMIIDGSFLRHSKKIIDVKKHTDQTKTIQTFLMEFDQGKIRETIIKGTENKVMEILNLTQ